MPARAKARKWYSIKGHTRDRYQWFGGVLKVKGRIRSPLPAAKIMARIVFISLLENWLKAALKEQAQTDVQSLVVNN